VALLVLLRLLASTSASGWLVGRRVPSWLSAVLPASSVTWMNAMVANGCRGYGDTAPRAQYAKVRPTSTTNELSGSSSLPTPRPRPRPSPAADSTVRNERFKETPAMRPAEAAVAQGSDGLTRGGRVDDEAAPTPAQMRPTAQPRPRHNRPSQSEPTKPSASPSAPSPRAPLHQTPAATTGPPPQRDPNWPRARDVAEGSMARATIPLERRRHR